MLQESKIWVQTVCKGHQQMRLDDEELISIYLTFEISISSFNT